MRMLLALLGLLFFTSCHQSTTTERPVLIVTTDLGQDPDDQQSLVRLLHYANEFDIRGLVLNADSNYDHEPPEINDSLAVALLDAYALIAPNLQKHDPGFPDVDRLRQVLKKGCNTNGEKFPVEDYIGEGKDTEGSDWIFEEVRQSQAIVHISIWGGACDVAQALWKARRTLSADELKQFLRKLRLYMIGTQDSSNQWIIDEFPQLWTILAQDSADKWQSAYRGVFFGGDMALTSREWLLEHVINVSPLGALYPDRTYTGNGNFGNPFGAMKEGDTPSWFYFLTNGLQDPEQPAWGGWGGRFVEVRPGFHRDAKDRVWDMSVEDTVTHARATVFRWRPDFQNDFAARVEWGVREYAEANHAPEVRLNGHVTTGPMLLQASPNEEWELDASRSRDPDGHQLQYEWMIYSELSDPRQISLSPATGAKVHARTGESFDGEAHIILSIRDNGQPQLTSYQRIIIRPR